MAERGWEPVIAPVLQVRPGAVAGGLAVDAVLVTSRNAIPALPTRAIDGVPLLAVGRATADARAPRGFTDVLDADGDAEDLAALALRRLAPGARVLVAHAQGQGGAL